MSSHTSLRVLAALAALVAPVALTLASGPAADAGSASPAATRQAPALRTLTALVNKKDIKKGKNVTIKGAVSAPDAPACAAGVVLNVERSTHAAVYKLVDTVTTDGAGAYTVKEKVTKKSRFRISVPATEFCGAAQSPPRSVNVV